MDFGKAFVVIDTRLEVEEEDGRPTKAATSAGRALRIAAIADECIL